MKRQQHIRRIFASLLFVIALGAVSCSTVSNAVQNLLTFDIKDSANIPISPLTPTGIFIPFPGFPIPIDSAMLAKNHTALSLIKTLKLTALTFTPDDPAYAMTNFDTISIAVGPDSLHTILLATYSGSANKTTLTNNDF